MIIVEQNKTYLVNFDNVEHISIAANEEETKYGIISVTKNDEIVLGVYETEERAKEVLQDFINWVTITKISQNLIKETNTTDFLNEKDLLYQMPEK